MTTGQLEERVSSRLAASGVSHDARMTSDLTRYLELLRRWNARINLTALPLEPPTDATIDKLLVEPLVAAPLFPAGVNCWIDLGSGGGSPALPLRLARRDGSLILVESRERKCAFLREAIRALELDHTSVTTARFEAFVAPTPADIVSLRAVRIDAEMEALLRRILIVNGSVLCFGTPISSSDFVTRAEATLPDGSTLSLSQRVR